MNTQRGLSCLLMLLCCAPFLQGCATVLSDRTYPVAFQNTGGPTYFEVRDRNNEPVHRGVTPQKITLDAKSSPFMRAKYNVTFAGSGEASQQRELKAGLDPWIAGNLVLGGVLGTVIDGATGAMFKLPEQVTGEVPTQYAVADPELGARIASIHSNGAPSANQTTGVQPVGYQANAETEQASVSPTGTGVK